MVWLDEAAEAISREPDANPGVVSAPGQLCYVVYTSGSTGRPKGVAAEHHEVVHLVRGTDYVSFGPGDRVAQASNASFDALTFEAWGALLNGATLVGIPKEVLLTPAAFRRVLREQRIATLYQTTALLNQLSREEPDIFAPLREVLFGGQAADAESLRRIIREGKPARLLHMYGPTETTAWCSWEDLRQLADDATTVSIASTCSTRRCGPCPSASPAKRTWAATAWCAATSIAPRSPPSASSPTRSRSSPARGCTAPATACAGRPRGCWSSSAGSTTR